MPSYAIMSRRVLFWPLYPAASHYVPCAQKMNSVIVPQLTSQHEAKGQVCSVSSVPSSYMMGAYNGNLTTCTPNDRLHSGSEV